MAGSVFYHMPTKNSRCDVFLEAAMHIVQSIMVCYGISMELPVIHCLLVLSGWIVPIIFLKEAIRVQKPKIAVVEVWGTVLDGMEYSEEVIYRNTLGMHWSKKSF